MTAQETYRWLMSGAAPVGCDPFERHAAAAVLAIGAGETRKGASIAPAVGLDESGLRKLADWGFPQAADELPLLAMGKAHAPEPEEQAVRDILLMYASGADGLSPVFSAMVARRCQKPNHLWQDLGLNDRTELSCLMERRFAGLARRNSGDMKWKKFLYRAICGAEGFKLCAAPVCTECADFEDCFGDETGESLLARVRLAGEVAAAAG